MFLQQRQLESGLLHELRRPAEARRLEQQHSALLFTPIPVPLLILLEKQLRARGAHDDGDDLIRPLQSRLRLRRLPAGPSETTDPDLPRRHEALRARVPTRPPDGRDPEDRHAIDADQERGQGSQRRRLQKHRVHRQQHAAEEGSRLRHRPQLRYQASRAASTITTATEWRLSVDDAATGASDGFGRDEQQRRVLLQAQMLQARGQRQAAGEDQDPVGSHSKIAVPASARLRRSAVQLAEHMVR